MVRRLKAQDCEILSVGRHEVDLKDQAGVSAWMKKEKPQAVFLAAAKVGGILANDTYPADFLYENLMIEANVIHGAFEAGVEKLMFLGSSCIYPKLAPQPITEEALLTGPLEPTNQWYGVAKIAGIKLCQAYCKQHGCDFISAMPTNLYGPGDNYDLETGHVAAALMVKTHQAKERGDKTMEVWGTGAPLREFMHVDDLADALVFLMQHYSNPAHINVGSGHEISIRDLAGLLAEIIGFKGDLAFDKTKPDGTLRKLMDSSKLLKLGWAPKFDLKSGFADAYDAYLKTLG